MMYMLCSALAIAAQAIDSTIEHRSLQETIAPSQHRIDAEKGRIAAAAAQLHPAVHGDNADAHKGRQLGAGWRQYMDQGLATGAQYANAGASGDEDFTQLSQETSDHFSALNHMGEQHEPEQTSGQQPEPKAVSPIVNAILSNVTSAVVPLLDKDSDSDSLHETIVDAVEGILTGPVWALTGIVIGRTPPPAADAAEKDASALPPGHATWKDYLQAGIQTGIAFANLGAGTAEGTSDPSMDFLSMAQLTADTFHELLVQGDTRQAAPLPRASPLASPPADQLSEAGGATRGAPANRPQAAAALASAPQAPNPPSDATWLDYLLEGIKIGLAIGNASAGTASGDANPSTEFGGLAQLIASTIFELINKGDEQPDPPDSRRRLLFADPQDRF
jgi:hypothetical protein